jgi:hypothetical protein
MEKDEDETESYRDNFEDILAFKTNKQTLNFFLTLYCRLGLALYSAN